MNVALAAADALRAAGEWRMALAQYEALLRDHPSTVEAWVGIALCHEAMGDLAAAEHALRECVARRPQTAYAHFRLGWLAHRRKQREEALLHYQRAAMHAPGWHEPHHHAAVCLHELRRYAQSDTSYRLALERAPGDPQILYHHAKMLKDAGHLDAAQPAYEAAMRAGPQDPRVAYSFSLLRLMRGEWLAGWPGYELRWQGSDRAGANDVPPGSLPVWAGETVPPDSGIVVYSEQGLGDSIQCFRYAEPLRQRFARVTFCVQAPLLTLFRDSAPPGVEVVARSARAHAVGTHCIGMLSLPGAFRTTPATVPSPAGYLRVPDERTSRWRALLPAAPGVRAGLVWKGGALTHAPGRDVAFEQLQPLLAIPRVTWVSLQKDEPPTAGRMFDPMGEVADFADTAALIASLDLVIAVDTAVAHLAGALGRPVWLLNRFESEWRWMRGRADTPWYASMALYNEPAPGMWAHVIDTVRVHLSHVLQQRQET